MQGMLLLGERHSQLLVWIGRSDCWYMLSYFPGWPDISVLGEGITDQLAPIVVCLGITGGRYSNARYQGRGKAGSGSLSASIGTTAWDQASMFDIWSSNLESFGYRGTSYGGQNTTVLVVRLNRPTPITFSYVCWMNRDILSSTSC